MTRRRQPDSTRRRLLQAAFREFHQNGYEASRLDSILEAAGVTKGALYHHFSSKSGLGYAVVDEVLKDWILDRWLRPVEAADDPIEALRELLRWASQHSTSEYLAQGCPLNNLVQEVSARDSGFRFRLAEIYSAWRVGLERALDSAKNRGYVRPDVDSAASAALIVAAWQGASGLSKAEPDRDTVAVCRRGLESYLASLQVRQPPE